MGDDNRVCRAQVMFCPQCNQDMIIEFGDTENGLIEEWWGCLTCGKTVGICVSTRSV